MTTPGTIGERKIDTQLANAAFTDKMLDDMGTAARIGDRL